MKNHLNFANLIIKIIRDFKSRNRYKSNKFNHSSSFFVNQSNQFISSNKFNQKSSQQIASQKLDIESKIIMKTFLTSFISSSFAVENFALKSSRILNNESNLNVCNNTMRTRFIKTTDVSSIDILITENNDLVIDDFDII